MLWIMAAPVPNLCALIRVWAFNGQWSELSSKALCALATQALIHTDILDWYEVEDGKNSFLTHCQIHLGRN